ncbi:MAG: YARHG domain-containing protein [Bacteroidales bacterium]|nr:YARHG domain-containing protein [Bacteroidales bacterium]
MKIIVLCILFFSLCISANANDGIVNSYGGNLFIAKESKIKMQKEYLEFTEVDEGMIVKVSFVFFNPGKARKDTVGFVTPSYYEPGMDEKDEHPNISNFSAIVNGFPTNFKIAKLVEEEAILRDITNENYGNFVYYFVVDFKPGANTVEHTYFFKPSGSSHGLSGYVYYNYVLKTAKNWAGEKIDTFECRINYSKPFSIDKNLEKTMGVVWKIEGEGVMSQTDYSDEVDTSKLFVNLGKGSLVYRKNNFVPETDISIVDYYPIDNHPLLKSILFDSNRVKSYTAKELRYARNALFAIQGYVFKSKELQEHFSNYFWYTPNPSVESKPEYLPSVYREILEMIQEEEKK